MVEMNITSVIRERDDDGNLCQTMLSATIGGETIFVPLDPANRHYAEIMQQVEAGTLTIQETE